MVEPYQLLEARAAGADLALLIVAALDDDTLRRLHDEARGARADRAGRGPRRGRDRAGRRRSAPSWWASTPATSRPSTSTPAPSPGWPRWCPSDRVLVAESGITGPDDVATYVGRRRPRRAGGRGAGARRRPRGRRGRHDDDGSDGDDRRRTALGWDADERGYFGQWGGRFMPEALVAALDELDAAWQDARVDPASSATSRRSCATSPTRRARSTTPSGSAEQLGVTLLLKREDLNHTGAHKIRNVLGQALLTSGWASRGSSPRPAPASTASPPPPRRRTSGSTAPSTWARSTPTGRRSTSPG